MNCTLYVMDEPHHRIRALHTDSTITVYQAYSPEIGLPAVRDGRFPAAWQRDRHGGGAARGADGGACAVR